MRASTKLAVPAVCALMAVGCVTTETWDKTGPNTKFLSQLPEAPLVTLAAKDMPVARVLGAISDQTGIEVIAADSWFAGFPISVSFTNATLAETLTVIMADLPCRLIVEKSREKLSRLTIRTFRGDNKTDRARRDDDSTWKSAGEGSEFMILKPRDRTKDGATQAVIGTTEGK